MTSDVVTPRVLINGQPLTHYPDDLFIPPDALEVWLETFTGPLDLLLYLIRRQGIDILNIPMVKVTEQYLHYIGLMEAKRMALAADYLVMAAWLIEIKSRLLLPKAPLDEEDPEEDPRLVLARRLEAYEQFKQAALQIDALPRYDRDVFAVQINKDNIEMTIDKPSIELYQLALSMAQLIERTGRLEEHRIISEPLSVSDRIKAIISRLMSLTKEAYLHFNDCFDKQEGRRGVVVTFLAILALAKENKITLIQHDITSPLCFKWREKESADAKENY